MKNIAVFCGSYPGNRPVYLETAHQMGQALVDRGLGLVYGGGKVGLMGKVADTVLELGGEAIGVMPKSLVEREIGHTGLTQLHVVSSMHERKAMMAELSDGFVALPGGLGTYEEICEVITWGLLGFHQKPCGFLNVENYYTGILGQFDKAVQEGFLDQPYRDMILVAETANQMLDLFETYEPPKTQKWVKTKEEL